MAEYDGLTPGQVLADASVAEFISQLGLGIAAAQRALDDNSVHQIAEFIVPREGLGGRTLLDLGLAPSFYHYQHADISCSLQLSLRVEKDTGVALNLSGSYQDPTSSDGSSLKTRHAVVHIEASSSGSLSVGGRRFALVGEDWQTRVRGLQSSLTETADSGIDLALVTVEDAQALDIATSAEHGVEITATTVAFIAGAAARGLIRISDNEETAFTLSSDETNLKTAVAERQADVGAFAARAAERIDEAGYRTRSHAPGASIESVHFATGASDLVKATLPESSLSANVADALLVIARLLQARPELKVELEGYADAQPFRKKEPEESTDLNLELANARAQQVYERLLANGAPSGNLEVKPSSGEKDALAAGGPADNQAFRRVDIRVVGHDAHWIEVATKSTGPHLIGVQPDLRSGTHTGNGFIYLFEPQPLDLSGKTVTIDGTSFDFSPTATPGAAEGAPAAYAANLARSINANSSIGVTASAEANVVTVLRNDQVVRMDLFTGSDRRLPIQGSDGVTVERPFPHPEQRDPTQPKSGNRAVAFGASLDVRYSRKFETHVTGNSSISARLVSIPAPPQFLETIRSYLTGDAP